ncbi:MAG: dihydropteroate synthase [Spirochaetales bacterium]|nr:dihydropteroate synthase [Spirochaetales bacterium]
MGIINCTTDSFYPGSRVGTFAAAVERARSMARAGADMLDIGGESTRPGSDPVDADEEIARVVPVIEAVRGFSDLPISVDTRKAGVAGRALDAGADIVNDISALRDDEQMGALVSSRGCPVILMHMRGTPKTMQQHPYYDNAVSEVVEELSGFTQAALHRGIDRSRIILDPGIGFGKRLSDNLQIMKCIKEVRKLGYPVLVGLSRKSFLQKLLDLQVEDRLAASLAAEAYVALEGAEILRVHDVAETVQLVRTLYAIQNA